MEERAERGVIFMPAIAVCEEKQRGVARGAGRQQLARRETMSREVMLPSVRMAAWKPINDLLRSQEKGGGLERRSHVCGRAYLSGRLAKERRLLQGLLRGYCEPKAKVEEIPGSAMRRPRFIKYV